MGDEFDAARDARDATPWQRILREIDTENAIYHDDSMGSNSWLPNGDDEGTTMEKPADAAFEDRLQAALRAAFISQAALRAPSEKKRWPAEPPVGSVLRYEHEFVPPSNVGQRAYTYVAVRTPAPTRPWYLTGSAGRERLDWDELSERIGPTAKCEIATAWFEIPAPTATESDEYPSVADYVAACFERDDNSQE